jgi:tetratricopeptide (TPR) repeat protein
MGDKKPYWNAAQFYNEYDKNNAKALEAIKAAVADNPTAFWMWIYKARIEKAMGDKAAAIASSQKSLELARAAKNPTYIKDNEDLLKSLK